MSGLCCPKGWLIAPPICQDYMSKILSPLAEESDILFYIYMDDIILGATCSCKLDDLFKRCLSLLKNYNFQIAPDKVQQMAPFKILGATLTLDVVSPVKPQLCIQDAYTLPQLQKLLGEINWMRP